MKLPSLPLGVAALAAVFTTAPQPAPDDERLARLLDLHARWRGGRATLARLEDVALSGTLAAGGVSGEIHAEATARGWSRVEYDLKGASETKVAGPDGGFAVSGTGELEPLEDADVAQLHFAQLRAFGRHLDPTAGVRARLLPDEEKEAVFGA